MQLAAVDCQHGEAVGIEETFVASQQVVVASPPLEQQRELLQWWIHPKHSPQKLTIHSAGVVVHSEVQVHIHPNEVQLQHWHPRALP